MKKHHIILCLCGVLLGGLAVAAWFFIIPSTNARRAWKNQALADITTQVADSAGISNELAQLKMETSGPTQGSERWFSPRLILMRNGEWLAYASVCHKAAPRISDLFLARGSDGQWYYSTYHFCVDMIVLRMEEQPENLAAFVQAYSLRPFDGHSDACLQKTWPPNAR